MCVSDAARIETVSDDGAMGTAWLRGGSRPVNLSLLTLEGRTIAPGDWVLVSAGLAIEGLDEQQAVELLAITGESLPLEETENDEHA